MSSPLKKMTILLLLAYSFLATANAQGPQAPCNPLPPPGSIDITNITYNSADANWPAVAPGAYYRVELKNLSTGFVEDLVVIQSTFRNYTGLLPGSIYQVQIECSTCHKGPFGDPIAEIFSLPIIITDEVVGLDPKQNEPDMQSGGENPFEQTTVHLPGAQNPFFNICIYRVPDIQNVNNKEDAFHAYIQLENSDFFEFAMVGDYQNRVHFSFPPLAIASLDAAWRIWANPGNGIFGEPEPNSRAVAFNVQYRVDENSDWENKMTVDVATTMVTPPHIIPLFVTLAPDVDFHASVNKSGVCAAETPEFKGNPGNNTTVGKIGPKAPVSPNPFTNHLNLNLFDFGTPPTAVRIIDATGRLQFEVSGAAAVNELHRIETAQWQKGMYYLQIQTETDVNVQPIIKL